MQRKLFWRATLLPTVEQLEWYSNFDFDILKRKNETEEHNNSEENTECSFKRQLYFSDLNT